MWFYILVYLSSAILIYFGIRYKVEQYTFIILIFVLIVIAGFRPGDCCKDYPEYINYYNNISSMSVLQLEPAYFVISYIAKNMFNNYLALFFIYALLGVSIKAISIKRLSEFYLISILLYISFYLLIHEMTQIRVGVASGFLLLSIPEIYKKNFSRFLIYIGIGMLFHYSLAAFSLCYFLNPYSLNRTLYFTLFILVCLMILFNINFITLLSYVKLNFISTRLEAYQYLLSLDVNSKINLLDKLFLLRLVLAVVFLYLCQMIVVHNPYVIILSKIYFLSALLYILLSPLPVLAIRMRELFGVVEIVLLPLSIYAFRKQQYVPLLVTVIIGFGILCIEIFNTKLVGPYF